MSARGTYQRGAKPDSWRTSGRMVSAMSCSRDEPPDDGTSGECRCDGKDPRRGRQSVHLLRRTRPSRARRTRRVTAVRSHGRAGRCAATPPAARPGGPNGRRTMTWARGPGAGCCDRCVPAHLKRCRFPESTLPDSGPVRRAEGLARYRRSRCHRNARADAGVMARRITVSRAEDRVRGIGRQLPIRAGLVAMTVPLLVFLLTRREHGVIARRHPQVLTSNGGRRMDSMDDGNSPWSAGTLLPSPCRARPNKVRSSTSTMV